jgi:hypothetical protein
MHVALLGDSTFDNHAYTDGGRDVVTQLGDLLTKPDRATLLAVDGATIDDVYDQLETLCNLAEAADPVTHVALSVGGNDLLGMADVLNMKVGSVGEALLALREHALDFGERYRILLDEVLEVQPRAVVCTVYGGAFPDPIQAAVVEAALRIFDHEIVEAALAWELPLVDLRRVCASPSDYFNPIEPNEQGGGKIASAVLGALRAPRFKLDGPPVTLQGTGGLTG